MKQEIIYKGKTIIEGTNGLFTAYPSNYSSFGAKDFKTLKAAKKYLDDKL
jgi:DNA-binding cell septation regulator SpoVG